MQISAIKSRLRIPFNAAKLGSALEAVIDLSDPLRTNVKFIFLESAMYADMFTVKSLHEDEIDPSGVITRVITAWETMNPHPDRYGLVRLNLVRMPQIAGIPSFSNTV